MKSKNMFWMETVVCTARKGTDARLSRLLNARQEMKRRNKGCVRAWVSRSMDGQPTFLVQSIYQTEEYWREISKSVNDDLDSRDGGVQSLLSGPPLVGIFALDPKELKKSNP